MTEPQSKSADSIPSEVYTREYYESCCQGYSEFLSTQGSSLPARLSIPLELASIEAGMQVVDIGCGRGEIVLHSAIIGARIWGMDYATEAVRLAGQTLSEVAPADISDKFAIQRADAQFLPIRDNSTDVVFMLDVVEHLYPAELEKAFSEIQRILKPGGKLVIHTMPNLWYYRFGYPLFRLAERMRGHSLPQDPRDRWEFRHVHVNEQTPIKLSKALHASQFQTRVWLMNTQRYEHEGNRLVRWVFKFLTSVYPFRWIFCNDIFAIGQKPKYEDRH